MIHEGHGVVLSYHRIGEAVDDPLQLSVSEENFASHLEALMDICPVVPLADVVEAAGSRASITFDDGYVDNLTVAKPILDSTLTPATVFVISGHTFTGRPFWWDELVQILHTPGAFPEHVEVDISGNEVWIDTRSNAGRTRASQTLAMRLARLPTPGVTSVLETLREELDSPPFVREAHRPLNADELRKLVEGNSQIGVGSHSVTHSPLDAVTELACRQEVEESLARLKEIVGHVAGFAYPYGAINDVSDRMVRSAGFTHACTTELAPVTADTDPFRIPRFPVRNWNRDEFIKHLTEWLGRATIKERTDGPARVHRRRPRL